MFLVVGLGNPDKEYQATRHNVGFMAADEIFRRHSFSDFKKKAQGLVAQGEIAGEKVLLVKPMTYMNLSGNCVAELVNFYKIPLKNGLFYPYIYYNTYGRIKARRKRKARISFSWGYRYGICRLYKNQERAF